ncbi:efflux RND transporter periplasmic adaptor subunit [Chlorobium sp.]|uniref:efflux RND transporter periplasmic adaptor subunit n=1 Tax=Chlorobium sp. TaxID=1095 RepID=UPI0025BAC247|nr:efflux RND transporter periplasmic adaptor subunit [Chlorobium sp.]
MTMMIHRRFFRMPVVAAFFVPLLAFGGCGGQQGPGAHQAMPLAALKLRPEAAVVMQEYPARLEGRINVEIRPQVDGILEKIYVDEGALVKAGQPLFRIDGRLYREQYNLALAAQHAAEASAAIARLDVDKLVPLVKNKVVSDIQLKSAKASLQAANANVEQARAAAQSARINLGYTVISAPVGGYIGTIPFRPGSLIERSGSKPLTILSDVREVYGYFSMSEADFMQFRRQYPGATIEEKIMNVPPVTLLLADGSPYPEKGELEMVGGQFDESTAAIAVRAVFPNRNGLLRTGNTGRVRLESRFDGALLIPQAATVEMQDKVFVFRLDKSGKVRRTAFTVKGKSGDRYIAGAELKPGDVIVTSGLGRLQDGMPVKPVFGKAVQN